MTASMLSSEWFRSLSRVVDQDINWRLN